LPESFNVEPFSYKNPAQIFTAARAFMPGDERERGRERENRKREIERESG